VTKEGSAFTTYLGADYRWHRTLLLGGMVQLDGSRQSILAVPDGAGGQAFMVGPYLAYQITPNVTFDATVAWGTSRDGALAGTDMTGGATTYLDEIQRQHCRRSNALRRYGPAQRQTSVEAAYRHRQRQQHRAVRLLHVES
jgi:hypothetical protein